MNGRPLLFQKISIENAFCNFWIDFGSLSIKGIHMCNATKYFEMWDNQFFAYELFFLHHVMNYYNLVFCSWCTQ